MQDRILSFSQKNDVRGIQRLIEEDSVSPNHSNVVGQTALHIASLWGNVESVEILLKLDAEPNVTNNISGGTPLHVAVQSSKTPSIRRVACARLLIEKGTDPNLKDNYENVALDYLDGDGSDQEYVKYMREALMSAPLKSKIFEIILQFDVKKIKTYFEQEELDVDLILKEREQKHGYTPLLFAVDNMISLFQQDSITYNNGKVKVPEVTKGTQILDIIQCFLEMGADPNTTPIYINAISSQNQNKSNTLLHRLCVLLFVTYQSCKNISDSSNENQCHDIEEVLRILEKTIIVFHKYDTKIYPITLSLLHDAARRDNLRAITFMVESLGIDPNTRGRQGLTPLHFAARSGRVDVVRWLLSKNVNYHMLDDQGKSAMDAAIVNEKLQVVELLKEK